MNEQLPDFSSNEHTVEHNNEWRMVQTQAMRFGASELGAVFGECHLPFLK